MSPSHRGTTINNHVYYRDTVVIGGSLAALLYAFHNNFPLYYITPDLPFRFDSEVSKAYHCINDLALWQQLHFNMTMAGLIPLSSKAESLAIDGNILQASTDRARVVKIHFNKAIVFEPEGVHGLPPTVAETPDTTLVYDWFDLSRSGPVEIEELNSGDNFVSKVILYPSERVDQNNPRVRDLVAISYLPHDKVSDFDYAETMASFKILEMLKEAGVRGRINGNHPKKPGEKVYLRPRLEATKREIHKRIKYEFEVDSRFEICYNNLLEIAKTYENDLDNIDKRLMLDEHRRYNRTYGLW